MLHGIKSIYITIDKGECLIIRLNKIFNKDRNDRRDRIPVN